MLLNSLFLCRDSEDFLVNLIKGYPVMLEIHLQKGKTENSNILIYLKEGLWLSFPFQSDQSSIQCSDATLVCSQRLFCLQFLVKLKDKEMFLVMWWAFAVFFHALLPSASCFPCGYIQALTLPYWDSFSFCLGITWHLSPYLCSLCLNNTRIISCWNWKRERNFRWWKKPRWMSIS